MEGYDLFALFDGHRGDGVANACRDRMHHLIVNEVEEKTRRGRVMEWEKLLAACFEKMGNEVRGGDEQGEAEDAVKKTMGSTTVVVLVGRQEMVVGLLPIAATQEPYFVAVALQWL